jgi:hypothetical protein
MGRYVREDGDDVDGGFDRYYYASSDHWTVFDMFEMTI